VGNWKVENHHVCYVPTKILPPTAPGSTFSTAIVTIQLKQNPRFYLLNSVPVMFCLPVLSAFASEMPANEIADRMGVLLVLLLTMAAYKVSMVSWVPQKQYLTLMDKYVICGFTVILVIGLFLCVSSLLQWTRRFDDYREFLSMVEYFGTWVSISLWVAAHVIAFTCIDFYTPWESIYAVEHDRLKRIWGDVVNERSAITFLLKPTREGTLLGSAVLEGD